MVANSTCAKQPQYTSADEAIRVIQSGQRIFLSGNASVPKTLLAALVRRAPQLQNVEICQSLTVDPAVYAAPEMDGHLRVNALFIGSNVRPAVQAGRADFTPVMLSEFPLLFKNNVLPLDVALIQVSPPDENGLCSLGVEVGLTLSAAESARIIIAEINEQMPRTLGDAFIPLSRLHYIVPVNTALPEMHLSADSDPRVIEQIAGFIADLTPDGATLQMGIGAIPDALLKHLTHKKNLGLHTEILSDGVMALVESGALTGAAKSLNPGKMVAGIILGSRKLYQWVHNNPLIEMHRTEYINDPFVIAQNRCMVAVNSAIEVDLTGQVCADSIGPRLYSGAGGQVDFIYGASRSQGGVPIIALPSTATLPNGQVISKISAMLQPGAGVVTSRSHVRFVVTEYGVADLYGKTIRQRAQALIRVAHPQFREILPNQARQLNYL